MEKVINFGLIRNPSFIMLCKTRRRIVLTHIWVYDRPGFCSRVLWLSMCQDQEDYRGWPILKMITFFCMILKVLQCSLSSQKNVPCQKDTPAHFRPPEPHKRISSSPFAKPDFLFCQTWFPFLLNLISFFVKPDFLFCQTWFPFFVKPDLWVLKGNIYKM